MRAMALPFFGGWADEQPKSDNRGICRAGSGRAFCPLHQGQGVSGLFDAGRVRDVGGAAGARLSVPRAEKNRTNPFSGDEQALGQGRDEFVSRCATCHGSDGRGATPIGANVYLAFRPSRTATQGRPMANPYIIANGIQLTGMPAMPAMDGQEERVSWRWSPISAACARRRRPRPHSSNQS